ncbi:MAG: hypothetical protein LBE13_14905 [Bacteroidales bacterium]|jgi:hypothetical protein|nr:hypothetical protein [Bacteroidales bacterium]
MKKNVIIILILIPLYAFSQTWQWVNESRELPMVECTDKEIIKILDSIFIKERTYKYYTDSLMISIVILKNSIIFRTSSNKTILFEENPLAYFYRDKHLCLIYYDINKSKFNNTREKNVFYYKKIVYSTKKEKDKIPSGMNDDGDYFSCWFYYYEGMLLKLSMVENYYTGEFFDYDGVRAYKELSNE